MFTSPTLGCDWSALQGQSRRVSEDQWTTPETLIGPDRAGAGRAERLTVALRTMIARYATHPPDVPTRALATLAELIV